VQRGICTLRGRILAQGAVWGTDFVLSNPALRARFPGTALTYAQLFTFTRDDLYSILEEDRFPAVWRHVRRHICWMALRRSILVEAAELHDRYRYAMEQELKLGPGAHGRSVNRSGEEGGSVVGEGVNGGPVTADARWDKIRQARSGQNFFDIVAQAEAAEAVEVQTALPKVSPAIQPTSAPAANPEWPLLTVAITDGSGSGGGSNGGRNDVTGGGGGRSGGGGGGGGGKYAAGRTRGRQQQESDAAEAAGRGGEDSRRQLVENGNLLAATARAAAEQAAAAQTLALQVRDGACEAQARSEAKLDRLLAGMESMAAAMAAQGAAQERLQAQFELLAKGPSVPAGGAGQTGQPPQTPARQQAATAAQGRGQPTPGSGRKVPTTRAEIDAILASKLRAPATPPVAPPVMVPVAITRTPAASASAAVAALRMRAAAANSANKEASPVVLI
jgi:hypothetical protein